MGFGETRGSKVRAESCKVGILADMLGENIRIYTESGCGNAGYAFPKNSNASKTALLNQITTLRNELLVLADKLKEC